MKKESLNESRDTEEKTRDARDVFLTGLMMGAMLKKKANGASYIDEACPFLSEASIENEDWRDGYEKRESE